MRCSPNRESRPTHPVVDPIPDAVPTACDVRHVETRRRRHPLRPPIREVRFDEQHGPRCSPYQWPGRVLAADCVVRRRECQWPGGVLARLRGPPARMSMARARSRRRLRGPPDANVNGPGAFSPPTAWSAGANVEAAGSRRFLDADPMPWTGTRCSPFRIRAPRASNVDPPGRGRSSTGCSPFRAPGANASGSPMDRTTRTPRARASLDAAVARRA